jgi:RNA polymerase sigma-70 factor (ECF subfamily)
MRRVILNTAIKYKKRNITKHSYTELDNIHPLDTTPSVIEDITKNEIIQLVQELPEGYRIVFSLYVIEGYSHKEIAEKLEIGESTSRSQLVKARALLRNKLSNLTKLAG